MGQALCNVVTAFNHARTGTFDMPKADDFADWARLFCRVWNTFCVPSQQLYELVRTCPVSFPNESRDLRIELLERYRNELLSGLTDENIGLRVRKFTTLLQLANFVGRTAYLKERALTRAAFHEANKPIPKDITERIATCEKWNMNQGGRYTELELLEAGYAITKKEPHQKVYCHPLSKESLTVYAKDSLSQEDRDKARALRESARHARRDARSRNPNKGASASKK